MKDLNSYKAKIQGLIDLLKNVRQQSDLAGPGIMHSEINSNLIQYLEYLSIEDFFKSQNHLEDAKEIDGLRSRLFKYEDHCDDLLRKGLLKKDHTQLSQQLYHFYNELLEDFSPSNRYLFNLEKYRNVRDGERRFGYVLVNYPSVEKSIAALPGRTPYFVARESDTIDILNALVTEDKPSLCISGQDYGDENAGIGKTVLATEITDIIASGRPVSEYGYLDDHSALVDQIREQYSEGVIWVSLHSYKKNREEYFRLIADALGVPFYSKEVRQGDSPQQESTVQLDPEDKKQLVRMFQPLFPELNENDPDQEVIHAVKTALENEWILDRQLKEALETLIDPQGAKNRRASSEKNAELFEEFNKNESEEAIPLPTLTEEELAAMEEERARHAHTRVDSLEKLAFILSSRKMLLVLDNAEQDRLTFEYIYARLRGFISILVTCRVPLPGIPTHALKTFTPGQAKKFFKAQNTFDYQEQTLEGIFEQLNFNPYCLSILANNLKRIPIDTVSEKIKQQLRHIPAPTTVDRIIAVIDATEALSEAEKSLLFDASIFFKEHFSAFELSCYDPDRTQAAVENQLHALYAEKRLVLIHQQADNSADTRYRLHESVRRYLRHWFEQAKGIQGKSRAEITADFEGILEENPVQEIEKIRIGDQRIRRYIENIRLINFLETPEGKAFEWKETYWSQIVWEYANRKALDKSDYFSDVTISLVPQEVWFMRVRKVDVAHERYNWPDTFHYFSEWSRDEYIRGQVSPLVPYASSSLSRALATIGILTGIDFSLYEATFKLRYGIKGNNLLVSFSNFVNYQDPTVSIDVKNRHIVSSFEQILQSEKNLEYDWEFQINTKFFTLYMDNGDASQAATYREKAKTIVSKFYDTPVAQSNALANMECYWAVYENNQAVLNEYIPFLEESDNDKLLFEIEYAIATGNTQRADELLHTLEKRGSSHQDIQDRINWHYYTSKYYLSQHKTGEAVFHLEHALLNKSFYHLPAFREDALKQELTTILGGSQQYASLSPSQLKPEVFVPNYFTPPETITDQDGKNMRLIPIGRVIKEDKKVLLPDGLYLQQKTDLWLSDNFKPIIFSTFSEDTILYSFYVDETPVTEEEFKDFFLRLPEHERQEYPEFNAENVLRYAEGQQKRPLTDMEWKKLYRGINYNIGDHYLNQHPLNEPFYQTYIQIFKETTCPDNGIDDLLEWLPAQLPEHPGNEIFSALIPLPRPLITAIAYSVTIDKPELKLKLLRQLVEQGNEQLQQTTYHILRSSILKKISAIRQEEEVRLEAELLWVSQKNLWRIALKYFLGIEKEFHLLPQGEWQEVVLIYENDIPKLVIKDKQSKLWGYQMPYFDKTFIPFRCMRLVNPSPVTINNQKHV